MRDARCIRRKLTTLDTILGIYMESRGLSGHENTIDVSAEPVRR